MNTAQCFECLHANVLSKLSARSCEPMYNLLMSCCHAFSVITSRRNLRLHDPSSVGEGLQDSSLRGFWLFTCLARFLFLPCDGLLSSNLCFCFNAPDRPVNIADYCSTDGEGGREKKIGSVWCCPPHWGPSLYSSPPPLQIYYSLVQAPVCLNKSPIHACAPRILL